MFVQHHFMSLSDAKEKVEAWRQDYNEARPHESLGYLAPNEFARVSQKTNRPKAIEKMTLSLDEEWWQAHSPSPLDLATTTTAQRMKSERPNGETGLLFHQVQTNNCSFSDMAWIAKEILTCPHFPYHPL